MCAAFLLKTSVHACREFSVPSIGTCTHQRDQLTSQAVVLCLKESLEFRRTWLGSLKFPVRNCDGTVVSSGAPAVRHGPHVRLAPQVAVVGADAAPDVHPAVAGGHHINDLFWGTSRVESVHLTELSRAWNRRTGTRCHSGIRVQLKSFSMPTTRTLCVPQRKGQTPGGRSFCCLSIPQTVHATKAVSAKSASVTLNSDSFFTCLHS